MVKILVLLFTCILFSPIAALGKEAPQEDRPINMIKFDEKVDIPKANRWNGFWYDVKNTKNDSKNSGEDFIKPSKMRWHIDNTSKGADPYIRCVD